jgi:hypothetical protein
MARALLWLQLGVLLQILMGHVRIGGEVEKSQCSVRWRALSSFVPEQIDDGQAARALYHCGAGGGL